MTPLEEYAKECGLHGEVTIEVLINSHRYLRSLNLEDTDARLKVIEEARTQAYKEAKILAKSQNWISREELADMTLAEIVEFIKG